MLSMTTDTAVSSAFELARATVADLHARLTRAPEGNPQIWLQVCRTAHIGADTTDPAALAPLIAAALQTTSGTIRLAVMSLDIRLRTHTTHSAL